MLGWVVVTEKLVAVPVELQTTPPEPLKPGSVLHAPEAERGKGHRFTARTGGAEKPPRVHARPAIGTKLTGGGIPSLTPRKAHVARQLQAAPRACGPREAPTGISSYLPQRRVKHRPLHALPE